MGTRIIPNTDTFYAVNDEDDDDDDNGDDE